MIEASDTLLEISTLFRPLFDITNDTSSVSIQRPFLLSMRSEDGSEFQVDPQTLVF